MHRPLFVFLMATCAMLSIIGCASAPPRDSVGMVQAEVRSTPAGAEISLRGRVVGRAPLTLEIQDLGEAVELDARQGDLPVIERRVRVMGSDRVQVMIRLGGEPSDLARRLGLERVVIFDYGQSATFESDRYDLKPSLEPVLAHQAQVLEDAFSGLDIYICGHTDSTGADEHNQILSLRRAESVADVLSAHGVDAARLRIQGFGSEYPVATNLSASGRALNRRTEIVLPD